MALNDSLELSNCNDDKDTTFRVEYPYPQAVENEEELVQNSARGLKKYHYLESTAVKQINNQMPPKQQLPSTMGISDSLQAELHLSLDRLSENSYDQDDLDRIKLKSQSGQKQSKVYPTLERTSQAANVAKLQQAMTNQTPQLTVTQTAAQVLHQNSAPKHSSPIMEPQLVHSSKIIPLKTGEYEDDEDDIHTVVLEDSLSLQDDVKSLTVTDIKTEAAPKQDSSEKSDPYSHLRYNPEWRKKGDGITAASKNNKAQPNYQERLGDAGNENYDLNDSLGGAITVHNHELLQIKDSPVRLSADPAQLLYMNQKYEEEFNRMLELEQRWQDHPDLSSPKFTDLPAEESSQYISQSKLQPSVSHLTFVVEQSPNLSPSSKPYSQSSPAIVDAHQATEKTTPKQQKSISVASNKPNPSGKKEQKSSYAPAPPRAPKSNRDYIELNKTRLGRKSNSASYLEMYSKKNRLLEQHRSSPRRPLTDVRLKEKRQHSPKREPAPDFVPNQHMNLTLEEQWKLQAQRLKQTKDGKQLNFHDSQRTALTEVGNNSKPNISPRHFVGHSPQVQFIPQQSANFPPKPSPRHSPIRGSNVSPKSDYSNHPAFSTFERSESPRKGLIFDPHPPNYYEDSPQYEQFSQAQPYINDPKPYHYSTIGKALPPFTQIQPNILTSNAEKPPALPYGSHHPQQEYKSNYYPSSLMQMEQQQFSHQVAGASPRYPFSPHQNLTPFYQQKYSEDFQEQRHLAEERMPAGLIPNYRNEMSSHYYNGESRGRWHDTDPTLAPVMDEETESSRLQSVPHLPPIPNATKLSPQPSDLPNSDKDTILRQNIVVSEPAGGGSYLQQHEKKKQKPSYKRYTLEDYRSLKRDINVGGLGPDLEAAKEKMEKMNRVKKYSEFIRQQHKSNAINIQNKSLEDQENKFDEKFYSPELKQRFTLGNTDQKRSELQEKRNKALEYARQVPKPKPIVPPLPTSPDVDSKINQLSEQDEMFQWQLLQNLRERHEREKAIVAEMSSPRHVT